MPDRQPSLDRVVAIVPLRGLEAAKSRLGEALDAEERRALVALLLVRTIEAAASTPGIAAVAVVSPDRAVLELAGRHGAVGVVQVGDGLNGALADARGWAASAGADGILVVPADLPAVSPAELTRLVRGARDALAGPGAGADRGSLAAPPGSRGTAGAVVALVPDRGGSGTNALFIAPPNAIAFRFGVGSRAAHAAAARAAGASYVELDGPLTLDLDTPDDLLVAEAVGLAALRAAPASTDPTRHGEAPRPEDHSPVGDSPADDDPTRPADVPTRPADVPTRPADALLVIPLTALPEVHPGDDLAALVGDALVATPGALPLRPDDVIVVTQKIVSKAEGAFVDLDSVEPRPEAVAFAARWQRDPRQVEVVLREAVRVVRMANGVIIAETRHGFVLANAGVDASNVGPGTGAVVLVLPADPDASARRIRDGLASRFGTAPGVVVSDSLGRPWRFGITDLAIGVSGFRPLEDLRGSPDADGRIMAATVRGVADEIASAAELVLGKSARRPVALVRGASPPPGDGSIRGDVLMPSEVDLFR